MPRKARPVPVVLFPVPWRGDLAAEKALPKAVRRVSVPQLLAQNTEKSIAQKSAQS